MSDENREMIKDSSIELLRDAMTSLQSGKSRIREENERLSWVRTAQKVRHHFIEAPILTPEFEENRERIELLAENGVVFIPDFLTKDAVNSLKDRLEVLALECASGGLSEKYDQKHYARYGRHRVFNIHEHFAEVMEIFAHPIVLDLVQSYLSQRGILKTTSLELRLPPSCQDAALGDLYPHFDHLYREVKVFLALEDIQIQNGPMVYWTKTHLDSEWRRLPEHLFALGGVWGEGHILTELSIERLRQEHPDWKNTQAVRCEIPAGGIYIADTRGVHRAGFLNEGRRLQLVGEYSLSGYERTGIPCDDPMQPLNLG